MENIWRVYFVAKSFYHNYKAGDYIFKILILTIKKAKIEIMCVNKPWEQTNLNKEKFSRLEVREMTEKEKFKFQEMPEGHTLISLVHPNHKYI